MAGKTTPWWRDVLTRAVRGIRAGVAAFFRPAKKPDDLPETSPNQENIPEEEAALTEHSPQTSPDVNLASEVENQQTAPEVSGRAAAPEDVLPHPPVLEQPAVQAQAEEALPEVSQPVEEPREEAAPDSLPADSENPSESPADLLAEAALEVEPIAEAVPEEEEESAVVPEPESISEEAEESEVDAEEAVTEASAEDPEPESAKQPEAGQVEEVVGEETAAETVAEFESAPELVDELGAAGAEPMEAAVVAAEIEAEATPAKPDEAAAPELAAEPELPAEPEEGLAEPDAVVQDQPVEEQAVPQETDAAPAAPAVTEAPETAAPAEPQQPQSAPLPPQAAAAAPQVHEAIKREQGPDTSPVSVFVNQVYEGPFDLLLDLIRKQDIDIYDIPIAKITAQFLAYVNQLKASDMDVAGEFIYTASLLIHIKSKMLLPREPKGGDDAQEDPRRELVERLLEHERFKNAAQMLQQKQMLEAATWTNPGVREFRENAGDAEIGPEIAADTTDLVRIFRVILERARNRPVINVQEDSVTVGQMIQFLGRRLTMEDKPVALHRLLAHSKSERALIAMFLALLELVRLQAILLRQDRHFSEIFIKKNSGFDAVMNQGAARDDWQ
jgi:segregation and condensation protein A